MKKKIAVICSLVATQLVWADPQLYGKANVTFEAVDEAGDSYTELRSNSSRLGVKGSETLNDALELIYQLEYGVAFDDDDTFSQRNIFIGVKGEIGTVIAGRFDTPLKRAQGKVDLFNDLRGDLGRVISGNENRESNSLMYSTPGSLGPFGADVAYIASEEEGIDDGKSLNVHYSADNLYLAVAADQDVEEMDSDAARAVGVYKLGSWQLSALVENFDPAVGESRDAWLISGSVTRQQWTFKAQGGESDIREQGGKTFSVGADYRLNEASKVFGFYTRSESDETLDDDYLGVGLELRF